jgi:ABC-type siderophore export system fused ATPase/permease subunit
MNGALANDLQTVISVLQTALTPAFLLVAVGSLLNVLTGRLSRIVDRARELQGLHSDAHGEELIRLVKELRISNSRMKAVELSILFSVLSAITVIVMIGLLFLMGLAGYSLAGSIVMVFMLSLCLLAGALLLFVREIQLAARAIHVPREYRALPNL